MAIPESGFRHTLTEVGHGVGLVTKPVWWPLLAYTREFGKDAHKLTQIPQGLKAQVHGWTAKARNDAALWDSWTPAQRRSVTRQKASWTGLFFVASILGFALPGGWALLPLTTFSLLWWARSHNFSRLPHADIVRWGLGLDQRPKDAQ